VLVSVNDLQFYMDVKFSEKQKTGVAFILEGLESELESFLRRPITVGTFTEILEAPLEPGSSSSPFYNYDATSVAEYSNYPVSIPLKNSPVASVISVYMTSTTSPSAVAVAQNHFIDYVISPFGIDMRSFPVDTSLTITYTAGLDGTSIKVFRSLILRAAAREAQNLHDDNRGLQDLEARGAALMTTGFTPEELASVKRWRRHRL